MKYVTPLLALVAAVLAQSSQNAINVPTGGFQISAGQPVTLTWTNPSSGTVTIKLQQGAGVTPDTGITLLTGVAASDKTATFTILADEVNNSQYDFEIIDESDPTNYNFSNGFAISGASCTGTCDGGAASTGSSITSTATSTGVSSSITGTSASSSASASSASVSSSSASASSSLVSSLSSSASSASASASSASASAAATTSAPSAGSAGAVKAQAGLVVALVAAVAAF